MKKWIQERRDEAKACNFGEEELQKLKGLLALCLILKKKTAWKYHKTFAKYYRKEKFCG